MATTSQYGLPYQALTDPPNGADLGRLLAEAVEAQIARIDGILDPPHCQLQQTVAQSLASGVNVPITVSAQEDADTLGWHSTSVNTSRVTPTISGWYQCSGKVGITNTSATGRRTALIGKNGVAVAGSEHAVPALGGAANFQAVVTPTIEVFCNGTTDYIELYASQDSGGAISTSVVSPAAQSFLSVRLVRRSSN